MSDLKRLCEKAGFRKVRTYIASGNVVAEHDGAESTAKAALEAELKAYAGKPVGSYRPYGRRDRQGRGGQPLPRSIRKPDSRDLPRPPPASRRVDGCERPSERGDASRRARDLRPLSGWNGPLEAALPGCRRRDRPQHKHGSQARCDGGGMRLEPFDSSEQLCTDGARTGRHNQRCNNNLLELFRIRWYPCARPGQVRDANRGFEMGDRRSEGKAATSH